MRELTRIIEDEVFEKKDRFHSFGGHKPTPQSLRKLNDVTHCYSLVFKISEEFDWLG